MDAQAPSELLIYCNCMDRVKHHIRIIENALSGSVIVSGHQDHSLLLAEVIFLHFRKALEEIAFASLSANREKYAAVRAGFATEWNARRMLGFIEKVNPNFYPLPLREPKETSPGNKHFDRMDEPFLTRQDFETLYDVTAEVLHSPNPFAPKKDFINSYYTVEEWFVRISRLLSWHFMQIVDVQGVWLMRVPRDAPAQASSPALRDLLWLSDNQRQRSLYGSNRVRFPAHLRALRAVFIAICGNLAYGSLRWIWKGSIPWQPYTLRFPIRMPPLSKHMRSRVVSPSRNV